MASTLADGLQKVVKMNGNTDPKAAQLAPHIQNSEDKNARMTSDWGLKVSNTDDWLSVSTEEKQGPALLEDGWGRERVSICLTS